MKASDLRVAGVLLVSVGILMLLAIPVLESVYPNFAFSHALSDLAASGAPTAIPASAASFAHDFGYLSGLYLMLRRTGRRGLMALFLIPSLAGLLPAFFPENVNVTLHSIGATISFVSLPVIEIASFRIIQSRFRYFAVAMGILTAIATVIIFAGFRTIVPATLGTAGWETLIVYPSYIWSIGLGGYLLAISTARDGPQ